MYSTEEFITLVEQDKINFELYGHFGGFHGDKKVAYEYVKEHLLFRLRSTVKYLNENPNISKIYRDIHSHVEVGESLSFSLELTCGGCGNTLYPILKDATTLDLYDIDSDARKRIVPDICPFANGITPKVNYIHVPSGRLVFSNFFHGDFDPKNKYYPEYELNHHLGRHNLADYYASNHNMGYGQMGNMSIGIYPSKDLHRIIVGDTDHKFNKGNSFYKKGNICLDMWRWMCCDEKILESKGVILDGDIDRGSDNYSDYIIVPVLSGTWKIIHYFDSRPYNGEFIYSTLEIVGG